MDENTARWYASVVYPRIVGGTMQPQSTESASALASFIPLILIQLSFLFIAVPLSKRININKWVAAAFLCIPVVGFFYIYYFAYRVVVAVFDRLDDIKDRLPLRT